MNTDPEQHMQAFARVAVDLATSGAEMALHLMGKTPRRLKDDRTFVTEADVRVQEMIVHRLKRRFPEHGIVAEESSNLIGPDELDRERVWAIDPIDGTRNFVVDIPIFTCSVALLHAGTPVVAAVAFPQPKVVYHASIYEPTRRNHEAVSVSHRPLDRDSVIAVSGSQLDEIPAYLPRWAGRRIIRDFGSVAYHLAMVACGQMDAAINFKGRLWDIAAGALLVTQAGGNLVALDPGGLPTDAPLWPIDLARYRRTAIPILAASSAVIGALQGEMRQRR